MAVWMKDMSPAADHSHRLARGRYAGRIWRKNYRLRHQERFPLYKLFFLFGVVQPIFLLSESHHHHQYHNNNIRSKSCYIIVSFVYGVHWLDLHYTTARIERKGKESKGKGTGFGEWVRLGWVRERYERKHTSMSIWDSDPTRQNRLSLLLLLLPIPVDDSRRVEFKLRTPFFPFPFLFLYFLFLVLC